MSRLFYHVMQDNSGNLLFDVSGTMRVAGSGTLATIYGDEALTVILPNPMTNHASFGSFKCFLPSGDFDFYMSKSGYTFETLTGVQGHGTMAQQDAHAVAITGGTATLGGIEATGGVFAPQNPADNASAFYSPMNAGGTNRWFINGTGSAASSFGGTVYINNMVGIQTPLDTTVALTVGHLKSTQYGLLLRALGSDTGQPTVIFQALGGAFAGSITTTATTTSYNTTSDARLKHAVEALPGALDVVRALKPITGRWIADDSPLTGFLAHEVQEVVDGVVTGEKDELNPDGTIKPQMIDYSKLVPYLVGAVKELTQQVEILQAQLAAVGE